MEGIAAERKEMGEEKWKRLRGTDHIRLPKEARQERDIELVLGERARVKSGTLKLKKELKAAREAIRTI